jgi:hypothetical protein
MSIYTAPLQSAKPARSPQRHPAAERGADLYETPAVAVEALLQVEKLPRRIWEPACGRGAIVNVLRAHGHEVVATDLVNYGVPISPPAYFRVDFLLERRAPEGTQLILTNPPFCLAAQFVAHALDLCPRVVMLLPLTFLEAGTGRAKAHILRAKVLDGGQLARVHVFKDRLPFMHRDKWAGPKSTSQKAFCWFVFERGHKGLPTVNRISWRRS